MPPKKDPASAAGFANLFIYFALCERDLNAAERAIAVMPPQGVGTNAVLLPIPFWKGFVARMKGIPAPHKRRFWPRAIRYRKSPQRNLIMALLFVSWA